MRNREAIIIMGMRRFSEIINELELNDLPLQGGPYTWRGGLNNSKASRLDRFLICNAGSDYGDGIVQSLLERPISDHFPIMIETCNKKRPNLLDSRIYG